MARTKLVLGVVLGLLALSAGSATAAKLITGKQIKNGSITKKDLASSAKPRSGPQGPAGAPGPQGPAGFGNPTQYTASASVPPGEVGGAAAYCPAGQSAVMGGFFNGISDLGAADYNNERTSYFIVVSNNSSISTDLEVFVWCVPSSGAVAASRTTRSDSRAATRDEMEAIEDRLRESLAAAR